MLDSIPNISRTETSSSNATGAGGGANGFWNTLLLSSDSLAVIAFLGETFFGSKENATTCTGKKMASSRRFIAMKYFLIFISVLVLVRMTEKSDTKQQIHSFSMNL